MEEQEGQLRETLSLQAVIFIRLREIGEISDRIYSGENPQGTALNYYHSVKNLMSIVNPYLGEKFKEKEKKIYEEADEIDSDNTDDSISLIIKVTNKILGLLMNRLRERGLLAPETVTPRHEEDEQE